MPIPSEMNEEFLLWFRARTEAAWRKYPIRSLEDFLEEERVEGDWFPDWQRGTKWLDGFIDEELTGIEQQWQIHFPPDYRLLLTIATWTA